MLLVVLVTVLYHPRQFYTGVCVLFFSSTVNIHPPSLSIRPSCGESRAVEFNVKVATLFILDSILMQGL
jgi:hypothetical protein